ncbi:MAG: hypothetical protein RLZZ200_1233 [Pseudomonadota bacterium]|jgi:ATP-binding cassette subfamily B protein
MAVADLSWPLERLGEGIEELARRAGLRPRVRDPQDFAAPDASRIGPWIEWSAARLGIEAEPVETALPDVEAMLRNLSPAVVRIAVQDGHRYLLLVRRRFSRCHVIAPDLSLRKLSLEQLRAALCAPLESPLVGQIESLMEAAGVPASRRAAVSRVMLRERLVAQPVGGCWLLRLPAETGYWQQLREAGVHRRVLGMLAVFIVIYALELSGWGLIGKAALEGRLDLGWLWAWLLLVLTLVPLHSLGSWLDARFALDAGRLLKQRLLAGALRLDVDAVRTQGAGRLLSRVMDSQALESLALNGGFSVVVAVLELLLAGLVLSMGAGGSLHVVLLAGWLLLTAGTLWRFYRRLRAWTLQRLDLTHDLVERMVGHRTRLAQEHPGRRDESDDRTLQSYLDTSRELDRAVLPVAALVPMGWMLVGLLGLAPAFVSGGQAVAGLAIGLGGVLLAARAFSGIAGGSAALARAAIAWEQVGEIFRAARPESSAPWLKQDAPSQDHLVQASGLRFRYHAGAEPVLRGLDLRIRRGDRLLLEGGSGGGKSTLASLLVGLRQPDSGLLLLNGLDRHTLGDSWHQLATEAPQFHENHILYGTIGFNLLMGRGWPASDADLAEARELCEELQLGELLDRMPSGMQQMVGETGWQLSHGERSRIFLARALLQKAPLTVLDESFAALDPETLTACLEAVFRRTDTLVVIAHP